MMRVSSKLPLALVAARLVLLLALAPGGRGRGRGGPVLTARAGGRRGVGRAAGPGQVLPPAAARLVLLPPAVAAARC
jgi:hypothetical protein